MNPLEFPILGALAVGFVIFGFSRVMLALPRNGAIWVFISVAAVVLLSSVIIVSRPKVSAGLVTGALVIGSVAVLAGGIVGASVGEREFETHGQSAEERATNKVADKAYVFAEIVRQDGKLSIDQAYAPKALVITLLFRNEDNCKCNLIVDAGKDAEGKEIVFQTGYVPQGKTEFLAVRFPTPGVFTYKSLGGPTEATGTITVS
jgi:hypothetical protein